MIWARISLGDLIDLPVFHRETLTDVRCRNGIKRYRIDPCVRPYAGAIRINRNADRSITARLNTNDSSTPSDEIWKKGIANRKRKEIEQKSN
ncbi:hypothetical protein TNCV_1305071 [Trichonephila clavipes]|nr:hypothetical protein TNCV_1305071 [Trichonephila clavipes]